MAKFTPNGTDVFLQKITTPPAAGVAIIMVTNTAPAVVQVAAGDIGDFVEGDFVTISGTNSALDSTTFQIGTVEAEEFALVGSDLSGLSASVAGGTATPIPEGDWLRFCLRQYTLEQEAADAIDVSTFCGAESLAGTPTPGTITVEGFMDGDVEALTEWRKGIKDGIPRAFMIDPPDRSGYGVITMTITPSGRTETWEVNEGVSFEGTAVINTDPVYTELTP